MSPFRRRSPNRSTWLLVKSDDGSIFSYHAHAYASVRGSVPALSTPVFKSITIAASDPSDHAPVTRNLWPRASNCLRTASGTRDSTERSPGYIVCAKGEAGNPRVSHFGASIPFRTFIPNPLLFKN